VLLFRVMQSLKLVVAAGLFSIAGCSDDDVPPKKRGLDTGDGTTNGAAALTCPADLTAPQSVAKDGDVQDLRVAGNVIYFRSGNKIVRIDKDGTGRADLYTSETLIRFFTDGTTLAVVESPNPPNAVIRLRPVATPNEGGAEIETDLVAAGTSFFGADATHLYALGENANGDTFYRVSRENLGNLETLTTVEGVVTDAQVVGGTIWYVRESKDIFRIATEGDNREPTLVASVGGCRLAVGSNNLFCTYDGAVEQRDLAGGSPRRALDATTSKVPVAFGGAPAMSGDALVVRSAGDGPLKNVLRSFVCGVEKVVACGRDEIGALVTDGALAVWIEQNKGVFVAPIR
jgi:hypothetical protein